MTIQGQSSPQRPPGQQIQAFRERVMAIGGILLGLEEFITQRGSENLSQATLALRDMIRERYEELRNQNNN